MTTVAQTNVLIVTGIHADTLDKPAMVTLSGEQNIGEYSVWVEMMKLPLALPYAKDLHIGDRVQIEIKKVSE